MISTNFVLSLIGALSVGSLVAAHGDASHGAQLIAYRRHYHLAHRALEAKCGSKIRARQLKRALAKRSHEPRLAQALMNHFSARTTENSSACLLTPEVTQGPYHVLGELYRQNITQGQAGILMQTEVDFIDVDTCEPVSNAWVDAWHANATGYYSSYISETGSALSGGSGGMGSSNSTMGDNSTSTANSTANASSLTATASANNSMAGSMGAQSTVNWSTLTSYTAGADSATAATQLDTPLDDEESFLRGIWRTDSDGHLTMYSIIPGWYSGRAQHFHIKVYPESSGYVATNGSFIANGTAVHTGQFFFDEDTLDSVAETYPYNTNSISWDDAVSNEDDQWYPYQDSMGYDALMDTTWVNSANISDGVISSITVGLNMSYTFPNSLPSGGIHLPTSILPRRAPTAPAPAPAPPPLPQSLPELLQLFSASV